MNGVAAEHTCRWMDPHLQAIPQTKRGNCATVARPLHLLATQVLYPPPRSHATHACHHMLFTAFNRGLDFDLGCAKVLYRRRVFLRSRGQPRILPLCIRDVPVCADVYVIMHENAIARGPGGGQEPYQRNRARWRCGKMCDQERSKRHEK